MVPGHYRFDISGIPNTSDLYLVSATSGGRDVLAAGIDLERDAEVEVVFSTPGGFVSGQVTDGKGQSVRQAIVALVPDAPLRSAGPLYKSVAADIQGNFEIRGISPGAYHLFSWSELEGAAYRNAEFMKKLEGRGTAVIVDKAARVSANVEIIHD
jgi:hypothetical protein